MPNILLMGMPGSGKSTVGAALSARLARPFTDIDRLVLLLCRDAKASLSSWRVWERRALVHIQRLENSVIALGGATALDMYNERVLRKRGVFVYLHCSAELLLARMEQRRCFPQSIDAKAPLQGIENLMKIRTPYFRQMADYEIRVDSLSVKEIVERIHGQQ